MKEINVEIYSWYKRNKRDLPWRKTSDPYKIWLSEIILQQTRIEQGMAYYLRFIEYFSTIFDLAKASEDQILKLWQGLGYYSRARNLHYTAKYIVEHYNGIFPQNYLEILELKGIGEYTASAIASIAFKQPYPVIDGNVYRVISRIYGVDKPIDSAAGKKAFKEIANELIEGANPSVHNQAMMEFGALQCKPASPNCGECPVRSFCYAYEHGVISSFPVKTVKTKQRNRYFNYVVIDWNDTILIRKRTEKDIWANLYEFPMIETKGKTKLDIVLAEMSSSFDFGIQGSSIESVSNWKIHLLSHQRIHYRIIQLKVDLIKKNSSDLIQVNKKDIFKFAIPKLLENYINEEVKFFI